MPIVLFFLLFLWSEWVYNYVNITTLKKTGIINEKANINICIRNKKYIMLTEREVIVLRHHKLLSMATLGFMTASLITTSFGGIFATAAFAAEPEAVVSKQEKNDNKDLMGGLLAIGVIALIAGHHGDDNGSSSKSGNTTSGNTSNTSTNTSSGKNVAADQKLAVDLLNADRAKNGLSPLKTNSQLTSLAGNYAQDMINRNFFAHSNPEGQTPFDRMKAAGISYTSAGENIAINNNVTAAETAFMNSSGHKANILNKDYTDVGVGVRYKSDGSVYVVQEFIGK
jgi:uncharacterized protein YkwD